MEEKFAKHRGLMVFHCRCIAGWTIACLIYTGSIVSYRTRC